MSYTASSLILLALLLGLGCGPLEAEVPPQGKSVFARENLVAWCVVPFDAKKRGPEERAQMLQKLGITRLAYDWREEHVPMFDQEIQTLKKHGIKLEAFWYSCNSLQPAKDKHLRAILDVLKRQKVRTQLWVLLGEGTLAGLSQDQKVEAAAKAIGDIATEANALGCQVGMYNHGGWFGEPENQLAILEKLPMKNVGIVYNFHHGHEHLDRFPDLFKKMQPHLLAINLNGMKKAGPKILPLGQGDRELAMLKVIAQSGWRGPVGFLGHVASEDVEITLRRNLQGLKSLLHALQDQEALKSFEK